MALVLHDPLSWLIPSAEWSLQLNQARAKAFARLNEPTHPGNAALEEVKADKDGLDSKTRKTREDIINLSFPNKQVEQFPKN